MLPRPVAGNSFNAANQMVSFNGMPLTYDADGNLINDGTNTYSWNERNRLVGMSGSPNGPASFAYDPFGRRVSKTVGGTTTQFQYDGHEVVQEIQPAVGNVLTNMGFSRTDLAGNMTFLGDLLGSTIALTDDSGAVDTQYSYEPFGAATASGSPSTNPYQFAFHQNDGTGLYYYSARYYSPTLARFISEDPSGARGGINLYEYAGDQPVTFEDSTGLSPKLRQWVVQTLHSKARVPHCHNISPFPSPKIPRVLANNQRWRQPHRLRRRRVGVPES